MTTATSASPSTAARRWTRSPHAPPPPAALSGPRATSPTRSATTAVCATRPATTSSSAMASRWRRARKQRPTPRNAKATRRWPWWLAASAGLAGLVDMLVAEVGSFDITLSPTAVETPALEFVGDYATILGLLHQRVGDLDLATLAWFGLLDQLEDVRSQNIAADDRKVGRSLFRLWLLDHAVHPEDVIADHLPGDHTVLGGFLLRHFLNGNNGTTELVVELDHLLQHAIALKVDAQIIRQHHGKGLVTNQRTPTEDGMPQPLHLDLTGVGERAFINQTTDTEQILLLVGTTDLVFKLVADVEMIFQGPLATAGNHGD